MRRFTNWDVTGRMSLPSIGTTHADRPGEEARVAAA
jgi:hypothetical protein